MYGCDGINDMPERWQVREYIWRRCPLKLITAETNEAIQAYNWLEKGIMPYNDGYKRNSNRYIQAMGIIGSEVRKIDAENQRNKK